MYPKETDMIAHYLAMLNPRFVYRDAGTGQFVTRGYALLHPKTTVRERVVGR